MDTLAQRSEETREVRERKRAVSVKRGEEGRAPEAVGTVLQGTPGAVRRWGKRYEQDGGAGLRGKYRGSES